MEANRNPGNVSCLEAREVLSDLIDIRRGEIPHPDGTPLAQPGKRAAVELHVAGCDACREELRMLEEVGTAFCEYAVGEPSAQHFADYGKIVRARVGSASLQPAGSRQDACATAQPRRRSRITWAVAFGASALAAASIFMAVSAFVPFNNQRNEVAASATPDAAFPSVVATRPWVVPDGPTPMRVMIPKGQQPVFEDFVHNPAQPDNLKGLRDTEGQCGYLVFGERIGQNERPLLGVELKTTREQTQSDATKIQGLQVYRVSPGTPAQVMGLQQGDLITGVNDEVISGGGVEDTVKFLSGVRHAGPEARIRLEVLRPMSGGYMYSIKEGTLGDYGQ